MSKKGRTYNGKEERLTEDLDRMRQFKDFEQSILPALREDLVSGMSSEELREKYKSYVQASQITAALLDPKAASERKDILDRAEGRATERKEIHHRLEKLPEEELDALLLSELEDASDDEISED